MKQIARQWLNFRPFFDMLREISSFFGISVVLTRTSMSVKVVDIYFVDLWLGKISTIIHLPFSE